MVTHNDCSLIVLQDTFKVLVNMIPADLKNCAAREISRRVGFGDGRLLAVWNEVLVGFDICDYIVKNIWTDSKRVDGYF